MLGAKAQPLPGAPLANGSRSTAVGDDGYVPTSSSSGDPFGDGVWLAGDG